MNIQLTLAGTIMRIILQMCCLIIREKLLHGMLAVQNYSIIYGKHLGSSDERWKNASMSSLPGPANQSAHPSQPSHLSQQIQQHTPDGGNDAIRHTLQPQRRPAPPR